MSDLLPKLEAWRIEMGLSHHRLGVLLGCSASTAKRLALGIRQPDATMAETIVAATGGAVSVLDLHKARLAFECRFGPPQLGEGGGEGGGEEGARIHADTVAQPPQAVTAKAEGGFA